MAVDIEEFYTKYGPMVMRRCRMLLRNEEKALDAMQDVFVRILRREKSLRDTAPSSLLYTTATNVCLNIIRDERRRSVNGDEEVLSNLAGDDDPEKRALTIHFLDRLFESTGRELPGGEPSGRDRSEKSTRLIAVLHYLDGFTLEETAAQVGMSVSGVRKRLRRLREKGLQLKEV